MGEDTSSGAPGTEPGSDKSPRPEAGMAERMRKAKESSQRSRVENARRWAPKASVLRYATVITCAVASLGMIVYFTGTSSAHEDSLRWNLTEIRELEKALVDSEAGFKTIPQAEELRPAFSSAGAAAEELAALQNTMADLNYEVKDRSGVLAEYGSMVDEAKRFFTTGSLNGGSFLPHGQWYQPHEPGKNEKGQAAWVRMSGDSWQWQAIPTKSADASGNITALWEARFVGGEDDGMLLAWVQGKYDPRRGQFFDMTRGLTVEGNNRLGATTSPPEGSGEESLVPAPSEKELIDGALRRTRTGTAEPTTPAPVEDSSSEPVEDEPDAESDPEMADPGLDGAN